ncbi:hypothetical protein LHFGNBLO_005683 [Mesorhizobium sp. AR10]|uniref:hypothetical protein n=1 Tax=Mesorhizobium sp. AR10 TaxID=2865839 RepID=UPI00215FEFDC|nr:hypothetical protein [Mesorhizobium sp. AR10]UVK41774.1 hypothetical protein LHFGNBLO_005683 [Mesorhizobium sp. AR10]
MFGLRRMWLGAARDIAKFVDHMVDRLDGPVDYPFMPLQSTGEGFAGRRFSRLLRSRFVLEHGCFQVVGKRAPGLVTIVVHHKSPRIPISPSCLA